MTMNEKLSAIHTEIQQFLHPQNKMGEQEIQTHLQFFSREATEFEQYAQETLPQIAESEKEQLDTWVLSVEGSEIIAEVVDVFFHLITSTAQHGFPGHDERHTYMVVLSGLVQAVERKEELRPYERLFLLGAVMHDFGRLLEPAFFGKPIGGLIGHVHPQMSFHFARRVLNCFSIPKKLIDHIVFSILEHQHPRQGATRMARAVQRADREQLIGPEAVIRMLGFDVGLHGLRLKTNMHPQKNINIAAAGHPGDDDFFHHIEFYMRNLFPLEGPCGEEWATRLKVMSGQFLWMSATDDIRKQIFAPEMMEVSSIGNFKKKLSPKIWQEIQRGCDTETVQQIDALTQSHTVYSLAHYLLHSPFASVSEMILQHIDAELETLNNEEIQCMTDGFAYTTIMRDRLFHERVNSIQPVFDTYPHTSVEYQIAY